MAIIRVRVELAGGRLDVRLATLDRILAMRGSFSIPFLDITSGSTASLPSTCKEVRSPGTFIPGVIKAGTYYNSRGEEFWMVKKGQQILNIEVKEMPYKRFVLGVENSEELVRKLDL